MSEGWQGPESRTELEGKEVRSPPLSLRWERPRLGARRAEGGEGRCLGLGVQTPRSEEEGPGAWTPGSEEGGGAGGLDPRV